MGLSLSLKGLGSGISESLGFKGHDKIGSLVGTWMNNFNGTTDAFNRSVASQWDFWNANNAYNSPSAVMQRYKEAGLNPNLIYGHNGIASTGSSPTMSSGGLSSALSAVRMYSDLRQQDAMTQQIRAQAGLVKQQTKALKLENTENTENGTSRATPYPVRLTKQVVNSGSKAVSSLAEPVSIQQSRVVDAVQKKLGVNYMDGVINKLTGRDWNYGLKSLSEQRKIYQRDLVRRKGWSR